MYTTDEPGRGPLTTGGLVLAVAAAVGMTACAQGESRNAPDDTSAVVEEAPAETSMIPAGQSMVFVVDRTVTTDSDEPGSEFTASLQAPLYDDAGDMVAAAGSPSRWIVTESSTEGGRSVLAFQLESLQLEGSWTQVSATVSEATIDSDDPDSSGETAAKIGIGAAAGALVGQVLGRDTESTLTGAGVGAAVGTAVALTTRDGHATLPEGSLLEVQLDEALEIR
jgi:hypothetical protein